MKETIRSTTTNIYMSFLIINKVDRSRLVWALVRLVLYERLTNWNKEKLSPYFEWSYLAWFLYGHVFLTNFVSKYGNHIHSASNDTSNFRKIFRVEI